MVMQNQPHQAGPVGSAPSASPLARLAQPRIVLPAVGLLGLTIDLLVRPLSWVGLVLLVLVATPWLLEAWSETFRRSAPAGRAQVPSQDPVVETIARSRPGSRASAPASPRPEQRPAPAGGQRTAAPQPVQAPLPMREPPRTKASAEPAPRPVSATTPSR